jgi:signal transduction histidine kinase
MNAAFMEKCLNQLNKLLTLINLFDISRIHAEKMQLRPEYFDFVALVNEVVGLLQETTGHNIIFQDNSAVLVTADHLRMEQVVTNLISNAVKYSPDGDDITVRVWTVYNFAHFSVTDKGIGIAKENLKDLFSQFYRAVEPGRNISGLGLGLFISKEIVERHGGTISVESELGIGSVFTFSIPLK